ncbi:TPA: hypothetical protein ACF2EA_000217 [Acinetobacter baumannii]
MVLVDPKPPLRSELAKVFKDQRTLKAFEKIFELIPSQLEINNELVEAIQITADNASAQAFLAVALIEAVTQLAELKAVEPIHTCSCNDYEDLSPRIESVQQDVILPSTQPIDPINLNLEVT